MGVIEKRLERVRKEKGKEREQALLEKCQAILEDEKPLRGESFYPEEEMLLSGFAFLSQKPLLIVYNREEGEMPTPLPEEVAAYIEEQALTVVPICGKVEMEIAELEEEERGLFLADLGVEESGRDRFIQYSLPHVKPHELFHRRSYGSSSMDDRVRDDCGTSRGENPLRYRTRLYSSRSHRLRRVYPTRR